jgi:triosephosphate isomerase (TIM)
LERVCFANNSSLWVGSQSCSSFYQGSYTGEVSARSVYEIGSQFVFVGHSERRKFLKETDRDITLQVKNGLKAGLKVVLCVGETLEERSSRRSLQVLRSQIISALQEVEHEEDKKNILIAYEPQYAIGTGILPELSDIEETMVGLQNIKNEASLNLQDVPLLYGGSINEKNYKPVVQLPYVQGLLIGGASLQIDTFKNIVSGCKLIDKKYVSNINKNYNVVENM